MRSKALWVLVTVLFIQISFIAWTMINDSLEGREDQLLFTLDRTQINEIIIEKNNQPPLKIKRSENHWILPEINNAKAKTSQVELFLSRLLSIKSSWPVAQTKSSVNQFKVGDNQYLAKIELGLNTQQKVELLLGLSPGAKSTYARIEGQRNIYLIPFNILDLSVRADDWREISH
ncbi:MAG TPA: DUF4340 domain-containing protein [Crenotrichaceae bacterium]|nr:DUF4340 domain-containing protein [Crenotrichaceae bacterium]